MTACTPAVRAGEERELEVGSLWLLEHHVPDLEASLLGLPLALARLHEVTRPEAATSQQQQQQPWSEACRP